MTNPRICTISNIETQETKIDKYKFQILHIKEKKTTEKLEITKLLFDRGNPRRLNSDRRL